MSGTPASGLLGRLTELQLRVGTAVGRRRDGDPAPDDPFRGLYLSDEVVDGLLAGEPDRLPPLPVDERRLHRIVADFGLSDLDLDLLVVALAPDVDSRFERLYGYLNDDVTRRRASIGLALELCAASPADAAARARLSDGGPLVDGGLVVVEDLDRPFLTRALRVPDRVAAHLLGDRRPDPVLRELLTAGRSYPVGDPAALARALAAGVELVYLRERTGSAAQGLACAALAAAGRLPLVLDVARLVQERDPAGLVAAIGREVRLLGGGLVAGPLDTLTGIGPGLVRALAVLPAPVLLLGRTGWDPAWSPTVPLSIDAPPLGRRERTELWRAELAVDPPGPDGSTDTAPPALDPAGVTAAYLLTPEQIGRAATAARVQARYEGAPVTAAHVRRGARAQNAASLERLARRIAPAVGWDDLVLPPGTVEQLRELAARVRHRDLVLGEWGMRPGGGRGQGITALFAGDSGTGKTMSAEVIAGELGLDLYAINLATVVDKYVGETEKNLERLFTEAAGVNGVLLFDEADAIFGKRSEVRDAHDRYANIESAYLLQRMESFDGLAVLATNLRANLDDAFTRRLDTVIDFPTPDEEQRRALWDRCLGRDVPRDGDLDLAFCAKAFTLSGGNIRSATLSAAYLAAAAGRPVRMPDVIAGVDREYRKLGRLRLESEFGPYQRVLTGGAP